jgi:HAD superfamily hydrolase (TIGR01509 family)
VSDLRAVLFDWRGTLAVTLSAEQWARAALTRLGRPAGPDDVTVLARTLDRLEPQLDGPGVDTDADLHRTTYLRTLAGAGLDDALVTSLYSVESDPACNPFAGDAAATLRLLHGAGIRLAVVSDIHIDIRPVFVAAGLDELIDVFTLSFEQGVQKPDPAMFRRTLDALGIEPEQALMVGDRPCHDGAAVDVGLTALLLPPLRGVGDRRLRRVAAVCGVAH